MPSHEQALPASRELTAATLRVTVVDDDRNEHLLLQIASDEACVDATFTYLDDGADLLLALVGATALEQLPHLIILDLSMPGIDGHRTLTELQSHPVFSRIPVVVFSSSSSPRVT